MSLEEARPRWGGGGGGEMVQVQMAPMSSAVNAMVAGGNVRVHGQCEESGFSNMNTEILPAKGRARHVLPKATKPPLAVLVSPLKE